MFESLKIVLVNSLVMFSIINLILMMVVFFFGIYNKFTDQKLRKLKLKYDYWLAKNLNDEQILSQFEKNFKVDRQKELFIEQLYTSQLYTNSQKTMIIEKLYLDFFLVNKLTYNYKIKYIRLLSQINNEYTFNYFINAIETSNREKKYYAYYGIIKASDDFEKKLPYLVKMLKSNLKYKEIINLLIFLKLDINQLNQLKQRLKQESEDYQNFFDYIYLKIIEKRLDLLEDQNQLMTYLDHHDEKLVVTTFNIFTLLNNYDCLDRIIKIVKQRDHKNLKVEITKSLNNYTNIDHPKINNLIKLLVANKDNEINHEIKHLNVRKVLIKEIYG